jgi:hypothetical protein
MDKLIRVGHEPITYSVFPRENKGRRYEISAFVYPSIDLARTMVQRKIATDQPAGMTICLLANVEVDTFLRRHESEPVRKRSAAVPKLVRDALTHLMGMTGSVTAKAR